MFSIYDPLYSEFNTSNTDELKEAIRVRIRLILRYMTIEIFCVQNLQPTQSVPLIMALFQKVFSDHNSVKVVYIKYFV